MITTHASNLVCICACAIRDLCAYSPNNHYHTINNKFLYVWHKLTLFSLQVSFESTQYEYSCVHSMINHYKWLFQVDEEETKKEEVSLGFEYMYACTHIRLKLFVGIPSHNCYCESGKCFDLYYSEILSLLWSRLYE